MLKTIGILACLVLALGGVVWADSWGEMLTVTDLNDLSNWVRFKDNKAVEGGMELYEPGIAKIWYRDTPTQRDLWTWDFTPSQTGGLDIEGYTTIIFLARFTPGAYLTVETKIDGKWVRVVGYYKFREDRWVEIAAPMPSGKSLELLRIGISEPGSPIDLGGGEVHVLLDWVKLSKVAVSAIKVTPVPDTITFQL